MACRKTERGATGFEGGFDNDFLSWKPGSIKTSLALDFEDDTPPPNVQTTFPVSKLDMDIDFDAGFSKLLSFNIDMPFSDGSPPAKQKTTSKRGNACTSPPKNIRRQQEDEDMDMLFAANDSPPAKEKTTSMRGNACSSPPKNSRRQQEDEDMDMIFADDLKIKKGSEEVEGRGAMDCFVNEFSPDGPRRSVNFAHSVVPQEELTAVPNSTQDDATKTDDRHSDPENIRRPEAGRGIPEKQTANVPNSVPVLSQPEANILEDISLSEEKSMWRSGSVHHEDSSSTEAAGGQEPQSQIFIQKPVRQPTSRSSDENKTIASVRKPPKLRAEGSGVRLQPLKPSLQVERISEPLEIAPKEPDSKLISTCPDEGLKVPRRALKLISVSVPDAKPYKQRLAKITLSGGEVKDFLQLKSSLTLSERKCGFVLRQPGHGQKTATAETTKEKRKLSPKKTATAETTKEKRKLSPKAVCPDTKKLAVDARPQHLDVVVRPSCVRSLENNTFLKLHVDKLGICRPSCQEAKGTSLLEPSLILPCVMPKPIVTRDRGQLPQRPSYFTQLSETKAAPDQFGAERSSRLKKRVAHDRLPAVQGCLRSSVDDSISHRNLVCSGLAAGARPMDAKERTKNPSPEPLRIATTGTSIEIDHPQHDLQDMCTDSAQQAVKFEKDLDDFQKMLKSRHEAIKDLLARACLLNSSWVLMNNPMDELKIKEIEEYIQQASI